MLHTSCCFGVSGFYLLIFIAALTRIAYEDYTLVPTCRVALNNTDLPPKKESSFDVEPERKGEEFSRVVGSRPDSTNRRMRS